MDKSKEQELIDLLPTLTPKQNEVVKLAQSGVPFLHAMKQANFSAGAISMVRHDKYRKGVSRLERLKRAFDDSYSIAAKQIGLSGERCVKVISQVLDDVKSRPFDRLMAVKEHHRIISSLNQLNGNNAQIALSAKNVVVIAPQQSIEEFNANAE